MSGRAVKFNFRLSRASTSTLLKIELKTNGSVILKHCLVKGYILTFNVPINERLADMANKWLEDRTMNH